MIDKREINEVTDDIFAALHSNLEFNIDILKVSLTQNEKGSTFYERVMVADGAIFALSLSFLGTMIGHVPPAHLLRHEFYSLVCPSWGLLLLSIFLGLHKVVGFHQINAVIVDRMRKLSDEYHCYHLGALSTRLSRVSAEATSSEARDQLAEYGEKAIADAKAARDESDAICADAAGKVWRQRLLGIAIMLFTQVAVVQLCVFTVRSLLLT